MGAGEYLEQLYGEMYPLLLRYAQAALEGDEGQAEETVQEAFAIAWAKITVLQASPNPRGWMMETLKHVIQNTRRSREKARHMAAAVALAGGGEVSGMDETSVDVLYGDLTGNEAYELMKAYALEHQTVEELASARGISPEACKKRVQRARKQLKKYFEKNHAEVSPKKDDLTYTK